MIEIITYKKGKKRYYIITFLIVFFLIFPGCSHLNLGTDVTSKIDYLGNPLSQDGKQGRALNIWDLQEFNNKIYLAGGSSVSNSGPINVWAYNPTISSFIKEYTVDEEAIEHFKVFDHELYIPAADPKIGDANKFYRRSVDGQWNKYVTSNISLAHVRDLLKTSQDVILMVGNNRNLEKLSSPAIAITRDNGDSFQASQVNNIPYDTNLIDYNWFFSIFSYQDKIYATSALLRDFDNLPGSIAIYDPIKENFNLDFKLFNSEFIPRKNIKNHLHGHGINIIYRIWNPLEYQDSLIYAARSYSNTSNDYNKAYMNSLNLYIKTGMGHTPLVAKFPQPKSVGEDILVIDNKLYALANKKISIDKFIVYVYKTQEISNKTNWQEVFHFKSDNKAKSFEYLNGEFYFGMGHDYDEKINHSGSLLGLKMNI